MEKTILAESVEFNAVFYSSNCLVIIVFILISIYDECPENILRLMKMLIVKFPCVINI